MLSGGLGLHSRDVPQHNDRSHFSRLDTLSGYSTSGNHTEEMTTDSTASDKSKKPTGKKKRSKKEDIVLSQNISGHRHFDNIDDTLQFVNYGKVSKNKEDVKGKAKEGQVKSKKKKNKGKAEAEMVPASSEASNSGMSSEGSTVAVSSSHSAAADTLPVDSQTELTETTDAAPGAESQLQQQEEMSVLEATQSENSHVFASRLLSTTTTPPASPVLPASPIAKTSDYIFTDFIMPAAPFEEEEFVVVKNHKKTKKLSVKEGTAITTNKAVGQHQTARNGPRPQVNNAGCSSPRSLSPGSFPVLGREGRRNSTGTVPTFTSPVEESDTESVKSLPMVPASPALARNSDLPSYANVVAKPRERADSSGTLAADLVIGPIPGASNSHQPADSTEVVGASEPQPGVVNDDVGYPPLVPNSNISLPHESVAESVSPATTPQAAVSSAPATNKAGGISTAGSDHRVHSAASSTPVIANATSSNSKHPPSVGSLTFTPPQRPNPSSSALNHNSSSSAAISKSSNKASAKKMCSVIFLDQKFHQPPTVPLDISFGFEPDLPATAAPSAGNEGQLGEETQQDSRASPSTCKGETQSSGQEIRTRSGSCGSQAKGVDPATVTPSTVNKPEHDQKSVSQGPPNGLVLPTRHKPTGRECVEADFEIPVVKQLAKPKPMDTDPNFLPGQFDLEGAVTYALTGIVCN